MIDMSFIQRVEGIRLDGYVPDSDQSKSGVTVATGVDLGQQTWQTMLALPDTVLGEMLRPYLGLRGDAAIQYLLAHPLSLTKRQALVLDTFIQTRALARLRQAYNAVRPLRTFDSLPNEAQTVIYSVAYQYGDLARRCPRFWQTAVAQDWDAMHAELLNFHDRYHKRRAQEAAYLVTICSTGRDQKNET